MPASRSAADRARAARTRAADRPRRGLAGRAVEQRRPGDVSTRDLQVDPVEQRPGQPTAVAPHLHGRAATALAGRRTAAAGARVGGEHELEAAPGSADDWPATGDARRPGLERLAQRLERLGGELRGLVEEQHAAVAPATRRPGAASRRRRRPARRPTRSGAAPGTAAGQRAAGRGGAAPATECTAVTSSACCPARGRAGCAGSRGRASSCRRRAARAAAGGGRRRLRPPARARPSSWPTTSARSAPNAGRSSGPARRRLQRLGGQSPAEQRPTSSPQVADREDAAPRGPAPPRAALARGHDDVLEPAARAARTLGQHPADAADAAVEPQLAEAHQPARPLRGDRVGRGQQSDSEGEVERACRACAARRARG